MRARKNWHHWTNNREYANDFKDFMAKKSAKIFSPDFHRVCLNYTFDEQTDRKIASIVVTFYQEEYIRIDVSSNSQNQTIYDDFKIFTESNKFHNFLGDYGKNSYISLSSDKLYAPDDAESFIELINTYHPLSTEIYQQLRVSCGLLPVRNIKRIQDDILQAINQGDLEKALSMLKSYQTDISDSIKPYCSTFSESDKSELLFFVAQQFQKLSFCDFNDFPDLEKTLKTLSDRDKFQRAIDCYQAISCEHKQYKDANLQISTLLDYYLKNATHSETEIDSLKKQTIEHALKSDDFRFVYNLLNSYTGRPTTSCSLPSNAGLIDLLFLLAKEGNDALAQLIKKDGSDKPTSSGPKLFNS